MDEVHKNITQGFQLDASSIKGFVSSIVAAFPHKPREAHKVEFKDGGVQVFDDIEDVISLPNVAKKEIVAIDVNISHQDPVEEYKLNLRIAQDEKSVVYDISSPSPNWNKSTQSECDEFSQSIKRAFWPKLAEHAAWVFLFGPFLIIAPLMQWSVLHDDRVSRLQDLKLALAQENLSAADAIYKYAEWSAHKQDPKIALLFFPIMIMPIISTILLRKPVINFLFKSQIFYLGGMINIVNQRRTMHALIWVSVVLSIVVGLVVNWLSKHLMP